MTTEIQNFKLIIVGDSLTGKSTFARRLSSDGIESKYRTSNCMFPLHLFTNNDSLCFKIHVPAALEFMGCPRDSFVKNSHCAIIIFDLTSPTSFASVPYWYRRIKALNGRIPIALCGNKSDIPARRVEHEEIISECSHRMKYFEISAKASTTLYEPILYLAEMLLKRGPITEFSTIGSQISFSLESLHQLIDDAHQQNVVE